MADIKAYPEEFTALLSEMQSLRESIYANFTAVNGSMTQLVSLSGPFYSRGVSGKVSALAASLKTALDANHKSNMKLLEDILKGFGDKLNENDKAS